MKYHFRAFLTAALLLPVSIGFSVERVEIVLDMSAEMWGELGGGAPRFVAVREALIDFAAASVQKQGRPEVSLRIVGGGAGLTDGTWCDDTGLLLPFGVPEPEPLREALADLLPNGGRPLVRGLEEAVADLGDYKDRRRIVLITSGSDQCQRDVVEAIKSIVASEPRTELRIIGLGLDRAVANAATTLAPTHNLFDASTLQENLEWALQPTDTRAAVAKRFEIDLTYGETPITSAEIDLTNAAGSERAYSTVDNGRAMVRLAPGRYRAKITLDGGSVVELGGLEVGGSELPLHLDLFDLPPVTLEPDPEQPLAGGVVHIAYWGAPIGSTWIALAVPDSPVDQYLMRAPSFGTTGEVTFDLPDSIVEFEARFINELQPGVFRVLGAQRFSSVYPRVQISSPERAENGSAVDISWTGPGHDGDHITIAPRGAAGTEHSLCLPVVSESGSKTAPVPSIAGDYVVFYLSRLGRILDRRSLEVFEVLATLRGPEQANPAQNIAFEWTGPDAPQDYLSLARPESPDDVYLSWALTADGNPTRFQSPRDPGLYEVRYIRAVDGVVLARHALEVKELDLVLKVPKSVAAGTRFKVAWTGTVGPGDFLSVAEVGSSALESLDFSYAAGGSPLSLAAPFEPGSYEVRYISGSEFTILAVETLKVR